MGGLRGGDGEVMGRWMGGERKVKGRRRGCGEKETRWCFYAERPVILAEIRLREARRRTK